MANGEDTIAHAAFWEGVSAEFYQALFPLARVLANNREYSAEDLVQTTFCRALTYSKNVGAIRNPLGYLLRIMKNVAADLNRNRNHVEVDVDNLNAKDLTHPNLVVQPHIQENLENRQTLQAIKARLGPLSERELLLLVLKFEGHKAAEIADLIDEDVRAVRHDLNAVMSKIRSRLKRTIA